MVRAESIRARLEDWAYRAEVVIFGRDDAGKRYLMVGGEWRECEDGSFIAEPTAAIPRDSAQKLMDDLWQAGMRPTDAGSANGQLDATKAHLKDMRAIVSAKLKIPL